jgi:hypothetical protein
MTIDELVSGYETEIKTLNEKTGRAKAEVKGILDSAQAAKRDRLTGVEDRAVSDLFDEIDSLRAKRTQAKASLDSAPKVAAEDAGLDRRSREVYRTGPGR